MLVPALVALALAVLFAGVWAAFRAPGSALAAFAWALYAPYEYLMHARVLCSGECNIRVDLLLLWPVLAALSLAVPFRLFIGRRRRR